MAKTKQKYVAVRECYGLLGRHWKKGDQVVMPIPASDDEKWASELAAHFIPAEEAARIEEDRQAGTSLTGIATGKVRLPEPPETVEDPTNIPVKEKPEGDAGEAPEGKPPKQTRRKARGK